MTNDDYIVDSDADTDADHAYYWTDERGRAYVGEGGGDIVRLNRLTAVAEHGFEALEADHIHHALYASDPEEDGDVLVNAPEYLVPVDHGEHVRLHREGEFTEVDGVPLLLPDDEEDTERDSADERRVDATAHAAG